MAEGSCLASMMGTQRRPSIDPALCLGWNIMDVGYLDVILSFDDAFAQRKQREISAVQTIK